jgi:SAM-dependent methyltransferase
LRETTDNSIIKNIWKFTLSLNDKISGSEIKARKNRFRIGQLGLKTLDKLSFLGIYASSRAIENPWVLKNLEKGKLKILDVGCCDSFLIYELIARGYDTYGIDYREYNHKEKVNFKKCDITKRIPFDDDFFDRILVISTIEHVGLGSYDDPLIKNGDKMGMKELIRIIKPDGKLLLTVPMSSKFTIIENRERRYDEQSMKKLIEGFSIEKEQYFLSKKNKWREVSKKEAFNHYSQIKEVDDMACLVLKVIK